VLTSLKADEMTSSETAIKNRIKEAFMLKMEPSLWLAIIKSMQQDKQPTRFKLVEITEDSTDTQDSYIVYRAGE
jgi:hypothetical protein